MAMRRRPDEILHDILLKEQDDGYRDAVVVGGLDRFLQRWSDELASLVAGKGSYSLLTPPQREQWAASVLAATSGSAPEPSAAVGRMGGVAKPRPPRTAHSPRRPRPQAAQVSLDDGVIKLKGVGPDVAARLDGLGIKSVRDLVFHFPHRHNDFGKARKVSELVPGQEQSVVVTVRESSEVRMGPKRASTQAVLYDKTGTIRAIWFNNHWLARSLRAGTEIVLSGRVSVFRDQISFESPEYELLRGQEELVHTGRMVPVYPTVDGLSQRMLRRHVKQALDQTINHIMEPLPESLTGRTGLMGLRDAVAQAHYPDSEHDWKSARRRLAFDELLAMQLGILSRKRRWREESTGIPLKAESAPLEAFLESLPFKLTGAQQRVLGEVLGDMAQDTPMSRMVQGDVGSGKTVVAAAALLVAAFNGYHGALMAPTEILAEQHFFTISDMLSGIADKPMENLVTLWVDHAVRRIAVGLLVGSLPKRAKDDMREGIARGEIDVVIGTQAIIQGAVEIPGLALAVVDEQHRFGVMQRSLLRGKGERPHVLAMTATPIPRSLALTLYGDLDVSVVDEMPPGRQPARTRWVEAGRRDSAYRFIEGEVEQGRQAFIVCPLIDGSDVIQARAATEEYERLSTQVFPNLRLGLLHGRMPLSEKDGVMASFKAGELDILVSTTVIEVGIDVPNATVMLVDGADRFGMAQLHQLRGRVGRGRYQGHCLLLADNPGEEARRRLKTVERITDGFRLAEEDLRLRGPGDHLGTRQSGLPDLKVAGIDDFDILDLARREAAKLLADDPGLSDGAHALLAEQAGRYITERPGEMS